MPDYVTHPQRFYIGGQWVEPATPDTLDVINPATERAVATIALGGDGDVDAAVAAAQAAQPSFSQTSRAERVELLEAIVAAYKSRYDDVARAIMDEMGAPWALARGSQAGSGLMHLKTAVRALSAVELEQRHRNTLIRKEPLGVVALITPWNWPANQIACKVAPALAAGCTMVLKPSEVAPLDAMVFAEIIDAAGVPAGVFNLVNGTGADVGAALAAHPAVSMVSFTGSTRAGIDVAMNAAPTVKRVAQELGGKSANILLDDIDIAEAARKGAEECFENTGQSCNAPTRMLVPHARMAEAVDAAAAVAREIVVGDPEQDSTVVGPVVSATQYERVQALINAGIEEGARVAAGGPGKPDGLDKGYFVRPTVFADVTNDMTIAREEIFGPVLSIIGYADDDEAVRIANDTNYGLSNYVSSGDLDRARAIAARLESGMVHINYAGLDPMAPFGGYKESGNGREWGPMGIDEFLQTKSIYGYADS